MSSDTESDYSSDYDSDRDEQPTKNKFRLVLCHHYHDALHGKPKHTDVLTHYLVIEIFKRFDISEMREMSDFYNAKYREQPPGKLKHRVIRNYRKIVTSDDYVKPEIAVCFELPDHECVCIKKTFWLRLIQRAWKRVYKERQVIIKKLSTPRSLLNRSAKHTRAPILPGLHGLLLLQ